MSNSITSSCVPVSIEVNLLEDKPGPVENLSLTPSNVSVSIAWSRPSTTNGIISGYTVSLNETAVCLYKMFPYLHINLVHKPSHTRT